MVNIKNISTENRNINTVDIDIANTSEILKMINNEDKSIALAVEKSINQIEKVVDIATETILNSGRIIYIGAGTSGRLGVLDASECPPTFSVDSSVIMGIIAGGDSALRISSEGLEDSKEEAVKDLKNANLTNKDFVIGIAASGRTPYTVGALEYANSLNCQTACITTSENTLLAKTALLPIEVITGPEPVTGSTRMKSGTAQKMVLNMISTSTMIKLGKVYQNLMVDVKMSNEKLISRGINIVVQSTGCTQEVAKQYVDKYKSAKLAIFAIISGIENKDEIEKILSKNNNNLRKALNTLNQ